MYDKFNILIHSSLTIYNRQVSNKPVVIYPNSGETYDAEHKQWIVSFYLNNDFKTAELVYHIVDEVITLYIFSAGSLLIKSKIILYAISI